MQLTQDEQAPASGTSRVVGKTRALLCERAARVAVACKFSLADIETLIPSQQHQFLLLRALIVHDKIRWILHVCNLHRWRMHNALHAHYCGSSAASGIAFSARVNFRIIEEDLADLLEDTESEGFHVVQSAAGGSKESIGEEERSSVEFLERVFYDDQYATPACDEGCGTTGVEPLRVDEKTTAGSMMFGDRDFVLARHDLCDNYRCEALFDVAEVHFMRGRIERALKLFTFCGRLFATIPPFPPQNGRGIQNNTGFSASASLTFHKDRLAGFIVACRMLLARDAASHSNRWEKADISKGPLPELGAPSPVQSAVISCEQTRWFFTSRLIDRCEKAVSLETVGSAKNIGLTSKRCREEGDTFMTNAKRRAISAYSYQEEESSRNVCRQKVEETTNISSSEALEGDIPTNSALFSTRLSPGECPGLANDVRAEKPDAINTGVADCLEHTAGTSRSASWQYVHCAKSLAASLRLPEGKELVQTLMDDLRSGFLPWNYCLSLERDPSIPAVVQRHLAACNIVREVVEGAPVESFLRISEELKKDTNAVGFILNLAYFCKTLLKVSTCRGLVPEQHVHCTVLEWSQTLRLPKRDGTAKEFAMRVGQRMDELAFYMCCVVDKPWCWALATELGFPVPCGAVLSPSRSGFETNNSLEGRVSAKHMCRLTPDAADGCLELQGRTELLRGLLQADTFAECQVIVSLVEQLSSQLGIGKKLKACCYQRVQDSISRNSCTMSEKSDSKKQTPCGIHSDHASVTASTATLRADMAACLRKKAFDTVENVKDVGMAKLLYELAVAVDPNDIDSELMLWLLDKLATVNVHTSEKHSSSNRCLSAVGTDSFPSFSLVEYVLLCLIDHDLWTQLTEFCQWGILRLMGVSHKRTEIDSPVRKVVSTTGPPVFASCKKQLQSLKVAVVLGDLMPLCGSIVAASKNHFNEDVGQFRPKSWQLFEEFLCLLAGIGMENLRQEGEDCALTRSEGTVMAVASSSPYPGASSVPLISRVRNPHVLTSLASLTAGWLHRCHAAGLTPWALAVERYGVLAAVTAGASLPPPVGSLPHAAAIYRPVPSKVCPEFGRDLFRVLLEGITVLPELTEGDEERGHCWFQGLADLAYEDEAYLKALQLYLQVGCRMVTLTVYRRRCLLSFVPHRGGLYGCLISGFQFVCLHACPSFQAGWWNQELILL